MWEKQKELGKKWFRRDNLIVVVLLGVLLFVIALPAEKKSGGARGADEPAGSGGGEQSRTAEGAAAEGGGLPGGLSSDYAREQEERLTAILSSMEGVGRVKVMLTIAASEELVVEKDTSVSRSDTDERDSAGGSRVSAETASKENVIYSTSGGGSVPYVVKTLNPRVEGVLVVAEGAGSGTVNRQITQIIQALFGVEAHRVKVVPMG